jgi:NitT/TauT family transport system substrate-binding protein
MMQKRFPDGRLPALRARCGRPQGAAGQWLRAAGVALVLLAAGALPLAQADEKVSLRTDWVNSGYHAIWYYGIDRGLFKAQGIDLEVLEGRGSASTAQTVANGSTLFGTSDAGAAMALASQGLPLRIVGGYLRQNPTALIFAQKTGWKKIQDMAGARVAYSPGGVSAQLLPAVLRAAGMEGKIRLVNIEGAAKPAALLEGKVDAIESLDFLQVPLFEANHLPVSTFRYVDQGITVPGLSLVAGNDTIRKNPELVRKIVALMADSIAAARKDPERAIDSLLRRAPTLNRAISLRILTLSFNLTEPEWGKGHSLAWLSPEVMERAQEVLLQYGAVKERRPMGTYFTNEFVPGG